MTDKETMKLALDALESCTPLDTSSRYVIYPWYDEKLVDKAITALKEALAQPEQTEVQQLIALVRAQQITIDKLEMALADHHMREVQRLGQEIEQEPVCPSCKAKVLYECVACSSNNYPPPQRTEPIQSLQCFHCQVTIETLNDKVMQLMTQRKPLTDDQIYEMYNEPRSDAEMLVFARAIEAAHGIKEKNT